MPANLEFEAEWIPSVHRVGVVPKEDPSRPGQLGVGGHNLCSVTKLCVSATVSAWGNGVVLGWTAWQPFRGRRTSDEGVQ